MGRLMEKTVQNGRPNNDRLVDLSGMEHLVLDIRIISSSTVIPVS